MIKTITICDFCKHDILDAEKFAIDAKIRHSTPPVKRKGFARVDMCRACYDKLIAMCRENGVEEEK